jgi:hypothetical protein
MKNDCIFYVYQYVDNAGDPYYIGKGKGNRIHAAHKHTNVPVVEQRHFIKTGLTESAALALENQLIRKYGRKIDGGIIDNVKINQWACSSGWNHKDETKKKISDSTTGILKSEETKQKMRKPKTKEHAENIRQANLGRKDDGRYVKVGATKRTQRWYTNGVITRMFKPGNEPAGFVLGRKVGM